MAETKDNLDKEVEAKTQDISNGSKPLANKRHERFAREYLKDYNATKAYKRCGYVKNSAYASSSRLLSNDKIQQRIAFLAQKQLLSINVTKERVLEEVARIAFADPSQLYAENGKISQVKDMPVNIRRAIKSIEVEEKKRSINKKVQLHSKTKALSDLMKHLGLFEEHNKQQADAMVLAAAAYAKRQLSEDVQNESAER